MKASLSWVAGPVVASTFAEITVMPFSLASLMFKASAADAGAASRKDTARPAAPDNTAGGNLNMLIAQGVSNLYSRVAALRQFLEVRPSIIGSISIINLVLNGNNNVQLLSNVNQITQQTAVLS